MDNNFIIIDLESVDPDKTLRQIINDLLQRNKMVDQQKLPEDKTIMDKSNNSKGRKYHCNNPDCKKEITKDVVAFCLHSDNKDRFKGKVYCRSCQEGITYKRG